MKNTMRVTKEQQARIRYKDAEFGTINAVY